MRRNRNLIYSMSCRYVRTLFILIPLVLSQITLTLANGRHRWEKPGCTKGVHVRVVDIPNCVRFQVRTSACRGFCNSCAYPSPFHTLELNPNLKITSRAECCSIANTHDVTVRAWCIGGFRTFTFKSALECVCSICRQR